MLHVDVPMLPEIRALFAARDDPCVSNFVPTSPDGEPNDSPPVGAARAATFGAIELLLVDIDEVLPGTLDDTDGSVAVGKEADASSYDVIDEIARRAILSGAKVLAVRRADLPDGAPLAAVLRYPV